MALIDTGADECALPTSLAARLGYTLEQGSARQVATAGGDTTAYRHAVRISVDGLLSRDSSVDFIPGLGMPLLGVNSFLSAMVLTVDYPQAIFTLTL